MSAFTINQEMLGQTVLLTLQAMGNSNPLALAEIGNPYLLVAPNAAAADVFLRNLMLCKEDACLDCLSQKAAEKILSQALEKSPDIVWVTDNFLHYLKSPKPDGVANGSTNALSIEEPRQPAAGHM